MKSDVSNAQFLFIFDQILTLQGIHFHMEPFALQGFVIGIMKMKRNKPILVYHRKNNRK